MTKSNGIKSLKQAAKLLNKHSPDGESLAYINPEEAKLLRAHGGSGIMTLSGVPSYNWFTDAISWVGDKVVEYAPDVWDFVSGPYKDKTIKDPRDSSKTITQPGRSFVQDAMSVWSFLRAKKDKEGLNAAEMEQFNKLNQQLAAAETEFDIGTDFGKQLTAPEYTTEVADVAAYTPIDFSGQSTPDLTLDAKASGGRIGYGIGGWLKSKLGLGQQEGTAYADPNRVVTGDPGENLLSYFSNKYSGNQQVLPSTGGQAVSGDNFMANMISQSSQGSQFQLLNEYQNYVTEVGEDNALPFEEWKMSRIMSAHGGRIGFNSGGETEYEKWLINNYDLLVSDLSWEDHIKYSHLFRDQQAQGGRIGAAGGGIMPLLNMGGMEKDYRQDGGFVPIGRKEKADDVPARLSKNEFVFTADAVRAAGGGDIDQGAQRMYNVMKNLEAGGDISEQSQGKA